MDKPVIAISSDTLIPVEQPFRIAAGPGAGKTHWLTGHIRNVLTHSERLGTTKKIACITYTNIAVDTIIKRFNFVADRVEVSTIHSFIYKNIIKPYITFIAKQYDFNVLKMDGHDDHFISRTKVTDWITSHPNAANFAAPYTTNQMLQLPNNIQGISNWLKSLHYNLYFGLPVLTAEDAEAFYISEKGKRTNLGKQTCLEKLRGNHGLLEYKKQFWRKGLLHHEDVLFFGHRLLKEFPFITSVIRAKFPYFFIDEFQDTSPLQAAILSILGEKQTIVGVIGDKAQSIFGFQGAAPEQFDAFTLKNIQNYQIQDNRRSTNAIIDVLNHIRKDITQEPLKNIPGVKPDIFVATPEIALAKVVELLPGEIVTTLAWDNITSNAMKRHFDASVPAANLIVEAASADSNTVRRKIILSCINALELAKTKRFKEAIKEMQKNFRNIYDIALRKKIAFRHLCFLLAKYEDFKDKKVIHFHGLIKENIKKEITKLAKGAASDFYNKYSYGELAICVTITEDKSPHKTIHKSKGDEFDNVLLILKKKTDLNFLLQPDLEKEPHRLFYVAVSRGIKRLFINVPEMDPGSEKILSPLFNIKR